MLDFSDAVLKRRQWDDNLYRRLRYTTILSVLHSYIQPNTLTIDVGGNTGYQTYWHTHHNPVVTYEPVPVLFEILKQNLSRLNVLGRIRLVNKAVGAHDGTVDLYVDMNRLSMTSQTPLVDNVERITVPMVRLDSENLDKIKTPGFIKIDVEGYEYQVIEGATKMIEKHRPHVMVEIYKPWCEATNTPMEIIFNWFNERNYSCNYYDTEQNVLVCVPNLERYIDAVENKHHLHDADFLFMSKD